MSGKEVKYIFEPPNKDMEGLVDGPEALSEEENEYISAWVRESEYDHFLSKLEEKERECEGLKSALLAVSKGCPTKAKGCKCLENIAMIALAGKWEAKMDTVSASGGK